MKKNQFKLENKETRLETFQNLQSRIMDEISKRKFDDVPTDKMFLLSLKMDEFIQAIRRQSEPAYKRDDKPEYEADSVKVYDGWNLD
jgi:hypothetical protein